jgi:hypothetical protein
MSRGPLLFKKRDLVRVLKAVRDTNIEAHVMIDRQGNILICPGKPASDPTTKKSTWEDAIAELEKTRTK